MIRLFFGPDLDDRVYPEYIASAEGEQTIPTVFCGPSRLVGWLEMHAGLSRPPMREYLRVEHFRQVMANWLKSHPQCFFSESFASDSWATAAAVLNRRDDLVLAGFDFQSAITAPDTPDRLRVIAEIESLMQQGEGPMAAGFADRVERLIQTIPSLTLPISSFEYALPEALLPVSVKRLIKAFVMAGIPVKEISTGMSSAKGTDLENLHDYLNGDRDPKTALNDGSIVVIRADREVWLAEYFAKIFRLNDGFKPLVLLTDKSRVFDNALIYEGLPSLGIASGSRARPVIQLLKLAPVFLWHPIDPYKALEFVSLPIKPLHDDLANGIAGELARRPGIKSESWNATVFRLLNEIEEKTEDEARFKEIRDQYFRWFERNTFDPTKGAPAKEAEGIFTFLANWAQNEHEAREGKYPSLGVLSSQAKETAELIRLLPENEQFLSPLDLERIIRTVMEPSQIKFREEEAGHLPYVCHPGAITEPAEALVWWNFTDSAAEPPVVKWYPEEIKWMASQSIVPDLPFTQNELILQLQKNPLLMTSRKLILVIPDTIEGKAVAAHPLLGDIEACFGKKGLDLLTIRLDQTSSSPGIISGMTSPGTVSLEQRITGIPRPYIRIRNAHLLPPRDQESYTSLENLFYYPYKWVFQYKSELNSTALTGVIAEETLMGNLAHRLLELMFKENRSNWTKDQVVDWVEKHVHSLLEREGSVLLLYGKEPVKASFIRRMKLSAWSLINTIQTNGWTVTGTEVLVSGPFAGITVNGVVDLVLKRNEGKEIAIVDMKWAGSSKYTERIKSNEDLQLVLYSKLITEDDRWAHTAYFVISTGKFYARNNQAFQEAFAVNPQADHTSVHRAIWQEMENTYNWRLRQLKQGNIEVRTEITIAEIEEMSAVDLNQVLEMKKKDALYDNYRALINLCK